jgi:hypothetical protein
MASSTPGGAHRLLLEISRTADKRFEGRIRATPDVWLPFSGVLELLKALEDLLEDASLLPAGLDRPDPTCP